MAQPYLVRANQGGPDLIERARDNPLSIDIRSRTSGEAAALTLSGSTVAVYDATGGTVLAATAIDTVSDGVATYNLAAASVPSTLTLGDGWTIVWTIVVDGVAQVFRVAAALCRYVPRPTVTPTDLYARHPDLAQQIPDSQAATGWYPQIHEAWISLTQRLYDLDRRPQLIVTGGSLRNVLLYSTLEMIYRHLRTQMLGDSRYDANLQDYVELHRKAWDTLSFRFDEDEDGLSDGSRAASTPLRMTSGPRWGLGR